MPPVRLNTLVIVTVVDPGSWRIVLRHKGPNFVDLGAPPPTSQWGAMFAPGRSYLRRAWWLATFPGLTITATVLVVNVLGDALRDALSSELKY